MSSRLKHTLRRGDSLCIIVGGTSIRLKLRRLRGVVELERMTDLPPGASIMVLKPSKQQRFRRRDRARLHRPLMIR